MWTPHPRSPPITPDESIRLYAHILREFFIPLPGHPPLFADLQPLMPPSIRISTNQKDHIAAAKALSQLLDQFGVRHAFIGGFAWSLLGSSRATEMSTFSLFLILCPYRGDCHLPFKHHLFVACGWTRAGVGADEDFGGSRTRTHSIDP